MRLKKLKVEKNKTPSSLQVGDKVTSDYTISERDVIRTITAIEKHNDYGSGYRASVNGGDICPCCGLTKGRAIKNVDAAWFNPIDKNN